MNKLFYVMFFVAVLVFIGQNNLASAQDVYCGTYSDGREAYLMTETVKFISYGDANYEEGLNCKVKSVKGNSVIYIEYNFEISEGGTVGFTNSQGSSGRFGGVLSRKGSPYPVESAIFEAAYKLRTRRSG